MSLTASMWTGISGLLAHGERMNVIGNNIANVNTLGFKSQRMDFEDFIYQSTNTSAGTAQLGRGVAISAIMSDFSQGSFETTTEATDLAIGGNGFFKVSVKGENTSYYTRAGNFRFDNDGYLVDPNGYALQGWRIQNTGSSLSSGTASTTSVSAIKGTGVPVDIKLTDFTTDPQHTTNVTVITNLDSEDGGDNTTSSTGNDFFALFETWDGTDTEEPLGENAYAYANTITVYDEGGSAHTLTIYYDQVEVSDSSRTYWEYMVTIDPTADNRIFGSNASINAQDSTAAGVLMIGTLTFDSSGQLTDMGAFTLGSGATSITSAAELAQLSNWTPTQFSTNHLPVFVANFSGASNASTVGADNAIHVELDLGILNPDNAWATSSVSNAAAIGSDDSLLLSMGTDAELQSLATTSYSGSSSTTSQSQDGYTFGYLQNIEVDAEGIISGTYSNGEILELFQVALYNFANLQGLEREGGNLYSATRDSGDELVGAANSNGLGSIASNSLEQSNVDLAREFVNMITTQRGFQANSKVITTTDSMLSDVINLKR
ncbi:MAG: flagellar basal-body rod protein FlgF [Desulfovibrionaceae bacterium]